MSLKYLFDLFNDKFETYKDELQYLAIEHLCVGHTYRLLNYPEATKQDFKDIIIFMEKYFENIRIKINMLNVEFKK